MSHSSHSAPHASGHPTSSTEPDYVDTAAIYRFGIGLTVITIIAHVAMFVWWKVAFEHPSDSVPRRFPLAAPTQESRRPPAPRLQDGVQSDNGGRLLAPDDQPKDRNPGVREALKSLRDEEDKVLSGYAWVDRNNQVVRIPVSDAMKLTLQRGLPSRAATPAAAPAAAAVTQERK